MIDRTHRFHGYNSLNGVYRNGKTVRGSLLSLRYVNRDNKPYRIAVVVSRKVHKSAVKRNRIRRRIFEICRRQDTVVLKDLDLIFTVFSDKVAEIDHTKLEQMVTDLLKKASKTPVNHDIVKPVKPGK